MSRAHAALGDVRAKITGGAGKELGYLASARAVITAATREVSLRRRCCGTAIYMKPLLLPYRTLHISRCRLASR